MKNNRLRSFVILLAILLTCRLSEGDDLNASFIKKVKGIGSVIDIIQTTDGNYISISRKAWTGPHIVRKVTPFGEMIWERTLSVQVEVEYGGYWGLESLAQIGEGYVLVGWAVNDDSSPSEGILIVLHPDGTVNWTKRFVLPFGAGGSAALWFGAVASTPDGGLIVTGSGYQVPLLVLKLAPDGSIQWQKTLPGYFRFLSKDDHGFILAEKISDGAEILKLDDSGNIVWSRILRIENFSLKTLVYDPDHGIVIAGKSKGSNTLSFIRLDSNGQIQWKAKYSMDSNFLISRILPIADGGYVLTGATKGDGFILKIDGQKRLVFQRTIGVPDSKQNAISIFATGKGGFVLFGSSGKSDQLFLRLNSDGLVPDCRYFHDLNSKAARAGSIRVDLSTVSFSSQVSLLTMNPLNAQSVSSSHSVSTVCQ